MIIWIIIFFVKLKILLGTISLHLTFEKYIEEEFDLVMIADYFDESLILLKWLLCWEIKDILYVKLRVQKKKQEFEEEVKKNNLTWNHADVTLFDHLNYRSFHQSCDQN